MSLVNSNNLMYNFTANSRRNLFILMGFGLLLVVLGCIFFGHGADQNVAHAAHEGSGEHADHSASLGQRLWANLLVNGYFFGGIGLAALFFYALHFAAQAAWSQVFLRIFSAVAAFLPIGMAIILIVMLAGDFGMHHIYHWMDSSLYDKANVDHYDEIIAHKAPYFNRLFFYGRLLIFFTGWCYYQWWSRKNSIEGDLLTGSTMVSNWKRNIRNAAIFLVFFGFTSSVYSWDAIMSIDTHWFSTLFGWYNFAGWWIGAIVVFNLLVAHIKSRNQMEFVNPSHVHDLGKWMFAVSFLWTYLWFSQFMLIWYSNLGEEVVYYAQRWEQYRGLFWITMVVNFTFPMLVLMSRDAKRNKSFIMFTGLLIFFFHWTDTFLMVMPGTVKEHWGIGLLEIGMFLFFVGFFVFWIFRALAQVPMLQKGHPYLEESLHHHI